MIHEAGVGEVGYCLSLRLPISSQRLHLHNFASRERSYIRQKASVGICDPLIHRFSWHNPQASQCRNCDPVLHDRARERTDFYNICAFHPRGGHSPLRDENRSKGRTSLSLGTHTYKTPEPTDKIMWHFSPINSRHVLASGLRVNAWNAPPDPGAAGSAAGMPAS